MVNALFESVFHSLEEQIAVIDSEGRILEVNRAWTDFGRSNGAISGSSCVGLNYLNAFGAPNDASAAEALSGIRSVLRGEQAAFYFEYPCHSPTEKRWFTMRVAAMSNQKQGRLFVVSHHNITLRKLAEERAEALAMQDAVTGLANRRAFDMCLNNQFRHSVRSGKPFSLALVDVDYFKDYNDEYGHLAGDRCLFRIGEVLSAHARRPGDLAARIGGDEFALVLHDLEVSGSQQLLASVLASVNDLNAMTDQSRPVTVSIGLLAVDSTQQLNEVFLMQEADKALYRAKSLGRNQATLLRLGSGGPKEYMQLKAPGLVRRTGLKW